MSDGLWFKDGRVSMLTIDDKGWFGSLRELPNMISVLNKGCGWLKFKEDEKGHSLAVPRLLLVWET